MGEKDILEKTLEAYNDVFADIVNGLLFQGRPVIKENALTDASPVSIYKSDKKVHEQERDVCKYWQKGEKERINVRIAFLGLENQTAVDRDMRLRVIGDDGAAYRAELLQNRTERYPVMTLVLYFGNSRWRTGRTLYDVLIIPENLQKYVSDYRINIFEIAFLTEEQLSCFHNDFRIVADYFVHSRTNPDYRPVNPAAFRHVDELLKLLAVLTQDDRFAVLLEEEGRKPENMCEVLDRVEARGIAKGMQKGIEKGKLMVLFDLVKNNLITLEQGAETASLTSEEFANKMKKAAT